MGVSKNHVTMETKIALHLFKKLVFFIIARALLRETDRWFYFPFTLRELAFRVTD